MEGELKIREFIDLYRSFPCLWKVKSKDYMNKSKRNEAYEVLVNKMKETEPQADRGSVVKKINNLRSSFRKELKKVNASRHSGAGEDAVYIPHLWYYDLLTFLSDSESPRPGISNVEEETPTTSQVNIIDEPSAASPALTDGTTLNQNSYSSTSSKRRKKTDATEMVLEQVGRRLADARGEDEFDIAGKNIAWKLRKLADTQRLFAEKIINDVLFEAQMNNLNRESRLELKPLVQTPSVQRFLVPPRLPSSSCDLYTSSLYGQTFSQWSQRSDNAGDTTSTFLTNFDTN